MKLVFHHLITRSSRNRERRMIACSSFVLRPTPALALLRVSVHRSPSSTQVYASNCLRKAQEDVRDDSRKLWDAGVAVASGCDQAVRITSDHRANTMTRILSSRTGHRLLGDTRGRLARLRRPTRLPYDGTPSRNTTCAVSKSATKVESLGVECSFRGRRNDPVKATQAPVVPKRSTRRQCRNATATCSGPRPRPRPRNLRGMYAYAEHAH